MRGARSWMLPAVLLGLSWSARAQADACGPGAGADAQQMFERGKDAMGVGRFADARECFQRSLELAPKASAAFNLAVALRGMGKPREADDVLQDLLAGRYGPLPEDRRAQVEQLATEARRDIATLVVEARGAPDVEVRVDGVREGEVGEGRSLTLRVNPGERVVTLAAKLRETLERTVVVAAGKSLRVNETLVLSRAARQATLVRAAENPADEVEIVGVARERGRLERKLEPGRYALRIRSSGGSRTSSVDLEPSIEQRVVLASPQPSLLRSPWFWSATAAALAGLVVGGVLLTRNRVQDPVADPQFGVVTTAYGR
jgi:hypothetical protein